MAQEIRALRERVEALQRRLDAQIEAEQQAKAAADAAAAEAAAARAAAATIPAQVQTAVDAAKPKSDKIYYKGATITLGGFLPASTFIGSAIPATIFPRRTTRTITATMRSRTRRRPSSVRARAIFRRWCKVIPIRKRISGAYTELDFQGAAQTANSVEDNSYNPSLRQLYVSADWDDTHLHLLAGQAWSLVTLDRQGIIPGTEVTPPTIDGQYMPGFTWTRQPQLRLTQDIGKQFWISLSLENPQTTFYTGANALPATVKLTDVEAGTGLGFNAANTLSLNRIPDVIYKMAGDAGILGRDIHVETYGLHRTYFERLNGENQDETGGGFGGGLIVPLVPRFLDFQVSGLAGKGIGRYGSGGLTDVTLDPAGRIQPIHEVIAMAGLTLHA